MELLEWLETVFPQIVTPNTNSVSIVAIDKDGQPKSVYWNCSTVDRAVMIHALMADNILEIVNGEDDDE